MTIDYTRSPQGRSAPQQQPRGNWFSRNWKWLLVVGCLLPLLLVGGCVAGLAWIAFSAIRSSDPYREALSRAQSNPEVIERLGSPVEPKWWLMGNVSINDDDGTADLKIPISGPKGEAVIRVDATKTDGRWTYRRLAVDSEGGLIDLLPAGDPLRGESTSTAPPGD